MLQKEADVAPVEDEVGATIAEDRGFVSRGVMKHDQQDRRAFRAVDPRDSRAIFLHHYPRIVGISDFDDKI
jgi:hypothetical protein